MKSPRKIMHTIGSNPWWGPPRKFTTEMDDRKVSWLELFYDLVYVIAISRITHHLSEHFSWSGLLDYIYFFAMIFWGWLNGSLYHDLHGNTGLRTRLMTLWQMMIIAALVITIDAIPGDIIFNATIVLMIMQLYITYLWWSVGIYDKEHRKLNVPYTVVYLISFGVMSGTLFTTQPYIRILFFISLVLNYLPPFISNRLLKRKSLELSLSESMSERLGLFTIIIFGEVVLGVVNGIIELHRLNFITWLNFSLGITIVFSLWWIFFTLVSDKKCKKGFVKSSILEILYIPTLMALGLIGVSFTGLFESFNQANLHAEWIKYAFGSSLAIFIAGISLMMVLLVYPPEFEKFKRQIQGVFLLIILLFILITFANFYLPLYSYLLLQLIILISVIIYLNYGWYLIRKS